MYWTLSTRYTASETLRHQIPPLPGDKIGLNRGKLSLDRPGRVLYKNIQTRLTEEAK